MLCLIWTIPNITPGDICFLFFWFFFLCVCVCVCVCVLEGGWGYFYLFIYFFGGGLYMEGVFRFKSWFLNAPGLIYTVGLIIEILR